MRNNPILKTLKENDIVLLEIAGNGPPIKQIARIFNLKFQKADDEYDFDWLNFDSEVLYTNMKLHETEKNKTFGNCLAIIEKVEESHLEQYSKSLYMWNVDEYKLSDEEFEYLKNK